jgi:cell division initiation protein
MRLTPIEIRQHRFGTRFRGLDPDEVHAFIDSVVEDFEEAVRENAQLKHDSERLLRELASYQGREKTIQDTLTTAQGVVDHLKQTAMKEAEVLVAEAEVRAEKLLKEAEVRRSMLQGEIGDLRRMRDRLQFDLRRMLEGYLTLVEPVEAEIAREPGGRCEETDDPRLGYLDLPRRPRAEG